MNCVHLIGRLATDIEFRPGPKVASAIIAVDRNDEEADFFRLKFHGEQADAIVGLADKHMACKGKWLAIRGKLRQDPYDAIDGTERKAVSIHVDELLGL